MKFENPYLIRECCVKMRGVKLRFERLNRTLMCCESTEMKKNNNKTNRFKSTEQTGLDITVLNEQFLILNVIRIRMSSNKTYNLLFNSISGWEHERDSRTHEKKLLFQDTDDRSFQTPGTWIQIFVCFIFVIVQECPLKGKNSQFIWSRIFMYGNSLALYSCIFRLVYNEQIDRNSFGHKIVLFKKTCVWCVASYCFQYTWQSHKQQWVQNCGCTPIYILVTRSWLFQAQVCALVLQWYMVACAGMTNG